MASPPRKKIPFQKRSRSVPFPRPYIKATLVSTLFFLSVISLITCSVAYGILQTQKSALSVVASLAVTVFIWTISIFARRAARCPLCQGTPYFDSGAHKHEKATKIPFLTHGTSNIVSTIFVQRFRCMYCGQPYDLLKPVTNPIGMGGKETREYDQQNKTGKKPA